LPIDEIEQVIHGRTRSVEEETLGIYRGIYSAHAADDNLRHLGQDGGTSMALLAHALDIGLINSFVTMDFAKSNSAFVLGNGIPMKTVPRIGSTVKDILETAGSKYSHGGVLGGLSDAASSFPNGRIGLVALPCELQGLWRLHTSLQGTYKFGGSGIAGGRPTFTIGLFCSKVYYHDKFVGEFIQQKHAIDPSKVTRTEIKRGKLKVYAGTEPVIEASLKELEGYMSGPCTYCIDYAAELADISVGAIGSPRGWNTVIVRTAVGEHLFESAKKANVIEANPIDPNSPDLGPLLKLCVRKKLERNAYYLKRGIRPERLRSK